MDRPTTDPSWDDLFATASGQEGLFTTEQAAAAGFSPQLLVHHVRGGKLARVRRGIYRLVHFPLGAHEEYVVAWLWSAQAGVISHESALALHGLSDALPHQLHLTLPAAWRRRRFRVPTDIALHHADVPPAERGWFGAVPITTPRRSLIDCAASGLSPELLRQAAEQALRRGLVVRHELDAVATALAPFGGLA